MPPSSQAPTPPGAAIERAAEALQRVRAAMQQVVFGQDALVESALLGLLAEGHILIEGVPGLAKTLVVKTLATCIDGVFSRIQFTPDLLPADITGTMMYQLHSGEFVHKQGPLFANLVLADEINRAPAKVQAALLEAMQERQVTIGEQTRALPSPFLVMATQNPLEHEGTFAMPEAELDRFMLLVRVDYPERQHERAMLDAHLDGQAAPTTPVCSLAEIQEAQRLVAAVHLQEPLREYILELVRCTREPTAAGLGELAPLIEFGASPRATLNLASAARARALLAGRGYVTPDDIRQCALEVLRHRIVTTYEADAEEVTSDDIVRRILQRRSIP